METEKNTKNYMYSIKAFLFAVFAFVLITPAALTFAQGGGGSNNNTTNTVPNSPPILQKLQGVGAKAGYDPATNEGTVLSIVGTVISVALSLLGIIFIILIIYAGFRWMTAGGDEEQIKKSGATIRSAILGLLIVIGAFAIWLFISNVLINGGVGPANSNNPTIH